jgi:hypothetical protein
LQRHPVVCLLLLSPGIPEYISGSSPTNAIVLNPGMFLFQILANLGLYGPGVLLVRDAMVRWKKGWASVLFLGAAYGILEEGIALSTLFDPNANPVGKLGFYGHWLGVNWVWVAGIIPVHMLFSISLPIVLLGLAVPRTNGQSLLSRRSLWAVSTVLGIDVVVLFVFVSKVWETGWVGRSSCRASSPWRSSSSPRAGSRRTSCTPPATCRGAARGSRSWRARFSTPQSC